MASMSQVITYVDGLPPVSAGYTVVSKVFGKQLLKSQPNSLSVVNCWNSRIACSMALLEKCRSLGATRTVGNSCDVEASENLPANRPAPSKEEFWMNVLRFMSNQMWSVIDRKSTRLNSSH